MARTDTDPAFHTFEYPSTGTTHVLRSSPAQKTVDYPHSPGFYAKAYCGVGIHLREGDLTPYTMPVSPGETAPFCAHCRRRAPRPFIAREP